MNNKLFAVMALCAISFMAVPAQAQNQAGGMSAGGAGQAAQGGMQDQQQLFQQRKADILARLQKVETCIQAANDQQALIACLPRRPQPPQNQEDMMQGGASMHQQGGMGAGQ